MPELKSDRLRKRKRGVAILKSLFWIAAFCCLLATVIGFFGNVFWAFDLASHFRLQYAITASLLGIFFIAFRSKTSALTCFIVGGVNLWIVLPIFFADTKSFDETNACAVEILGANVLTSNPNKTETINYLRECDVDVILCVETDEGWFKELSVLVDRYPYLLHESFQGNFGITLLSRIELANARIEWVGKSKVPAIVADVQSENPFTIIGGHVVPPMSREGSAARNDQLMDLAQLAKDQTLPVVMLGDFNITPYSPFFSDLLNKGDLRDSRQGFGIQSTWPTFNLLMAIPIDHCLVQQGIRVKSRKTGTSFGSDHLPIILELEIEK